MKKLLSLLLVTAVLFSALPSILIAEEDTEAALEQEVRVEEAEAGKESTAEPQKAEEAESAATVKEENNAPEVSASGESVVNETKAADHAEEQVTTVESSPEAQSAETPSKENVSVENDTGAETPKEELDVTSDSTSKEETMDDNAASLNDGAAENDPEQPAESTKDDENAENEPIPVVDSSEGQENAGEMIDPEQPADGEDVALDNQESENLEEDPEAAQEELPEELVEELPEELAEEVVAVEGWMNVLQGTTAYAADGTMEEWGTVSSGVVRINAIEGDYARITVTYNEQAYEAYIPVTALEEVVLGEEETIDILNKAAFNPSESFILSHGQVETLAVLPSYDLTVGGTTEIAIEENTRANFTLAQASRLTFRFKRGTKATYPDLTLELKDENEYTIYTGTWTGVNDHVITDLYLAKGSYQFFITRSGDTSEPYGFSVMTDLKLSGVDSGKSGSVITLSNGSTQTGIVTQQDVAYLYDDEFSFTLSEPSKVKLTIVNHVPASMVFRLSNETGHIETYTEGAASATSHVESNYTEYLEAGEYKVRVDVSATEGYYTLGYSAESLGLNEKEVNDTPQKADQANNALVIGSTYKGLLGRNDVDDYIFTVDVAQRFKFTVNAYFNGAELYIYNFDTGVQEGFSIISSGGTEDTPITLQVSNLYLTKGAYYAQVKPYAATDIGVYTIKAEAMSIGKEIDYQFVYDYDDYRTYNPDLVKAFGDNRESYINHFINSGMKEGRRGKTEFNLEYYYYNYEDLRNAFGENKIKYYQHYQNSGHTEGRVADKLLTSVDPEKIPSMAEWPYRFVYNYQYYKATYSDISSALGNKRAAYLNHFLSSGLKEGRWGCSEFNIDYYIINYGDLFDAFGMNLMGYVNHYQNYGKAEGRKANTLLTPSTGATRTYKETAIAEAYDYRTYRENNADLAAVYGRNRGAYYNHFINSGMFEDRTASPNNFRLVAYVVNYGDLFDAYGTKWIKYAEHFTNNGKKEGRNANTINATTLTKTSAEKKWDHVYDFAYVYTHYEDLRKSYGLDRAKYYNWFINTGMKQGKRACETFDAWYYRSLYADLQNKFKNDMKKYYDHYQKNGWKEGRKGAY